MKECPECSMFNASTATKCKWCGASLSGGGAASSAPAAEKKLEDPAVKEKREKEEKRRKIITYVGYGVIAAALVGWVIYMQVKKSKEPPPEEKAPAAVSKETGEGDEADETVERAEPEEPGVERSLPQLGERVVLDDAGLSIRPFPEATIIGAGDAAVPDASKLFEATSREGTVSMTVREVEGETSGELAGEAGARLMADYVLDKSRPITLPAKKKGKTAAGSFVMFKADLGDSLERVYYLQTDAGLVQIAFTYPAKDGKTVRHERIIDEVFSSLEPAGEGDAQGGSEGKAPAAGKPGGEEKGGKPVVEKKTGAKPGSETGKKKTPEKKGGTAKKTEAGKTPAEGQ
jgi:hypothetical protein